MESTAIQAIFDRDGYIALPVFVNPHKLREIREHVERFIESQLAYLPPEQVFFEDKSRPETLKQLQQLHRYDEYFGELMTDSPFERVAETVLKGPVVAKNMQYFNKPPGDSKPTPAHQDGVHFHLTPCAAVSLWLALDDTDEDNGCVRYARGSHCLGLLPHQRTDVLGFSQALVDAGPAEDERTAVICPSRAGDLLVHHALTIHWADANPSNHRHCRALAFTYYSASAQEDTEQQEAYQRQLTEELTKAGKI